MEIIVSLLVAIVRIRWDNPWKSVKSMPSTLLALNKCAFLFALSCRSHRLVFLKQHPTPLLSQLCWPLSWGSCLAAFVGGREQASQCVCVWRCQVWRRRIGVQILIQPFSGETLEKLFMLAESLFFYLQSGHTSIYLIEIKWPNECTIPNIGLTKHLSPLSSNI